MVYNKARWKWHECLQVIFDIELETAKVNTKFIFFLRLAMK